jgi:hypothetical protein
MAEDACGKEGACAMEDESVKETCRRIRVARGYWDAHNNAACRMERDRALALYETLTREQKDAIPQVLRVWLRYRSEKYFGPGRTAPARGRRHKGTELALLSDWNCERL